MLTLRHIEEMMVNSLRSPLNLCDRLALKPTDRQFELLEQLAEQPEQLDLELDANREVLKAVAMYALWRTFAYQGARCTVIAANKGLASAFMGLLYKVTTSIDPAVNSAVRWTSWRVMKVGADTGHEVRLVPNQPVCVAGRGCPTHTVVILGAGESETAFVETLRVLNGSEVPSGESRIRLW